MQDAQQSAQHPAVCGAKNKSFGGQCESCGWKGPRNERHGGKCQECGGQMLCQATPVNGSKRCRMHGGKAKKGPESAAYKHGAYSQLQEGMGLEERARRSMTDPELLDLRYDAAVLAEIIKEVLSGDRAVSVGDIRGTFRGLSAAMRSGDFARARDLMLILGDQIEAAANSQDGLAKVEKLIAKRAHVVSTERRLQIQQGAMISAVQVSHAMNRLVQVVVDSAGGCQHCGGRTLSAVRDEYSLLVGSSGDG